MSAFYDPRNTEIMRLGHLADLAKRTDPAECARYNREAALLGRDVATIATDDFERGVLWSSACAYAYHARDRALLTAIANECASLPMPDKFRDDINELLRCLPE